MSRSARVKAGSRAVKTVEAIKKALRAGDSRDALAQACAALRSEAAHQRRVRPSAHAALLDAQLAGMIAGYAVLLADCQPPPPGSPLAVFAASFEQALTGASGVTEPARGVRVG
jgi:hypothetical protein